MLLSLLHLQAVPTLLVRPANHASGLQAVLAHQHLLVLKDAVFAVVIATLGAAPLFKLVLMIGIPKGQALDIKEELGKKEIM